MGIKVLLHKIEFSTTAYFNL